VWSPLAGGYLAGKYRPGAARPNDTRAAEGWAFPERYFHPDREAILAALLDVAAGLGRTPAQVALRWVLDRPFITSAIVGARNAAQIADSLGAVGWRLPEDAAARLDKVSFLPHRYPRAMEDAMEARRNAAVK
jgi:aryl-alcohol dehydrogenase-like predicted oxidoreductase